MQPGMKPTKKLLARMKAMNELGHGSTQIGKELEMSHNTVLKYLRDGEVFKDPDITEMVEMIKKKETDDLYLIGAKARRNLHTLLDEGKMKAIENIAAMDRSFQQRRLLEGLSTENISQLTKIVQEGNKLGPPKDRLRD